jgi:hypothetical protein
MYMHMDISPDATLIYKFLIFYVLAKNKLYYFKNKSLVIHKKWININLCYPVKVIDMWG